MSAPGELVTTILHAGSAAKLLAEHAPDGRGRCSVCRSLGCTLFAAAAEAQRLADLASQSRPDGAL
jgi:hypothetical protein